MLAATTTTTSNGHHRLSAFQSQLRNIKGDPGTSPSHTTRKCRLISRWRLRLSTADAATAIITRVVVGIPTPRSLPHPTFPPFLFLASMRRYHFSPHSQLSCDFAWKGMTIRFQADPISLHEPVFPGQKLLVRPEIPLELKNHDYGHPLSGMPSFGSLSRSDCDGLRTASLVP